MRRSAGTRVAMCWGVPLFIHPNFRFIRLEAPDRICDGVLIEAPVVGKSMNVLYRENSTGKLRRLTTATIVHIHSTLERVHVHTRNSTYVLVARHVVL